MARGAAALLAVFALAASAQNFPVPLTPEIPLSDPVFTAAAGVQSHARVGTNGDIALIAWQDLRQSPPAIYASRLDANGNPLDPLGVRIGDSVAGGGPDAVIWNGEWFIVVAGQTLIFVAPDMTVRDRKSLPLDSTFNFAAATTGPDVRLLFLLSTRDAGSAAVVDSRGAIASSTKVWTNTTSARMGVQIGAAGNGGGFVVLREVLDANDNRTGIVADSLDRSGNVVASVDSGLPDDVRGARDAMAPAANGFLLVEQSPIDGSVIAYALDASGVYHGGRAILAAAGSIAIPGVRPAIAFDSGSDLVTWAVQGEQWIAEIARDGTASTARLGQWSGTLSDIAVGAGEGRHFATISVDGDVYAQVPPSGPARLVTATAPTQYGTSIAAGANGYAVTWIDDQTLYIRRFSATGVPQDSAPLLVATNVGAFAPRFPKVVSNGEVYAIYWQSSIRRLEARSGRWIDATPVALPGSANFRVSDIASNGADAMVVGFEPCGFGTDSCVAARRIPMSSEAPGPPVISVATRFADNPVLASDGTDYFFVWTNQRFVPFPVDPTPWQIFGLRLRADGTAIDGAPLPLDSGKHHPYLPQIAWGGGRYLVVWYEDEAYRVVYGTRVTPEGAVLDRDADGGAAIVAQDDASLRVTPTAFRSRLVLLLGTRQAVIFSADTDLRTVPSLPRTTVSASGLISAAPRDELLALAYNRLGLQPIGGINRVFLQIYGEPSRRRPVAH
jgi:hypothetical protein